jgi:cytochrome c oxidase subunit II
MLQYLLTFVVLAQPAQPAEVPPTPPAEATAPAPAGEAGDAPASEAVAATGDPCDPNAPRPGGAQAKEMPPPGERTDIDTGNFWMPPSGSTATDSVDWLFYGILGLSIFCFAGITISVVYFSWRYRHRKGHSAEPSSSHNDTLEVTWTVIPSIICVIIFLLGWKGFMDLNTAPKHAYEVQVVAKKWDWSFKYPNGWVDTNLHVPVGEPIRLVMRSTDVLHSFWVPAFRVKNDVIPNRYTKIWFEATTPGVYRLYCAEYCGTQHSNMKQLVVVHPPGGFERYMEEAEQALLDMPPVKLGEYLQPVPLGGWQQQVRPHLEGRLRDHPADQRRTGPGG